MKRNDLLLVFFIIVVAVVLSYTLFLPGETGGKAVISVNGKIVKTMPLSQPDTFKVETNGHFNIVEIKDGYADVIEADCPDKLCVKQKKIQKTSETIVCLPHKLIVEVENGGEEEMDGISG